MTPPTSHNTEELLTRAQRGDDQARQQLLTRFRERLKLMVGIRLDSRLAARLDPSDVVQEVLAEADRKLPDYLRDRPLPYYPWLRQLAWERLVKMHRTHLKTQKRTVTREEARFPHLPSDSALALAERLLASQSSPSRQLLRQELRQRVQAGLDQLSANDRELLVMRYLEHLSMSEIAAILDSTEGAVKVRHLRALRRLRLLLGPEVEDDLS